MSQTLCLQFVVHVHAPSEFQGKKATEAMLDAFCLMAIVQGQLQHMLVNEQLRKIEDFMLKILNIPKYSLVSFTKKNFFEKKFFF